MDRDTKIGIIGLLVIVGIIAIFWPPILVIVGLLVFLWLLGEYDKQHPGHCKECGHVLPWHEVECSKRLGNILKRKKVK